MESGGTGTPSPSAMQRAQPHGSDMKSHMHSLTTHRPAPRPLGPTQQPTLAQQHAAKSIQQKIWLLTLAISKRC